MRILNKMRFISLLLMLLLVVMMAAPKMVMAAALGSDATLKASSTVKGETLLSLGSSSASGDIWSNGGTVTITAAEAANTTNLTPYITLFDPTYAGATVKVVKYAQWSNVGNFDSAPAYANQAITNQDYFWVKVTAPDTTTLYYKVNVTVTPAPVSAINITGDAVVGAILTAAPTPSGATGAYQWKSSDTADGTYANITGATSSTYVIDEAYLGDFIKVTFTASGSYTGTQTSVATDVVAAALGSDATLKASSTVKGETLLSLGSSSASGDIWSNGGTVTITAAEAANTTNLTPYITLFDPTYAGATVKVVKYAQWSNVGNFDSAPAYANQAITNQDYFWVKVTAPDTTTLYYKVVVTVTPIANVSAITVTGNTVVGATLTAAPTPSGATGTYQWKSSGSADGTYANITGATSSTYVIGKAYKRKFIKVTFTATGSYSGTQTSVATTAVSKKGKILK